MKFPLRIPEGADLILVQPYANESNNEWYRSRGITAPFHNGIDVVVQKDGLNTRVLTYGTACLTPTDGWHIAKKTFVSPLHTKGNGMTIESPAIMVNGESYLCQLVFWHLSEVTDNNDISQEETVFGLLGNSGTVFPAPTPECALCGSHLHFMKFLFKLVNGTWVLQAQDNGVGGAIDPLTAYDANDPFVFELDKPFRGEDTGIEKDLAPFSKFLTDVTNRVASVAFSIKKLIAAKNKG